MGEAQNGKGIGIRMKRRAGGLILAMGISIGVLSAVGFSGGRGGIYQAYEIDRRTTPELAKVFMGIGDGVYPWSKPKEKTLPEGTDETGENSGSQEKIEELDREAGNIGESDTSGEPTKEPAGGEADTEETGIPEEAGQKDENIPGNGNNEPEKPEKPADGDRVTSAPVFEKVEEDYFDDALFIGDSRTVGLHDYAGLDNASYYADVGLTIWDALKKEVVPSKGSHISIAQALKGKQFGKIYIMLGINEMGTGTPESFGEQYKAVVKELRRLQPNAIIYIQGIMNVGKKKSDSDKIFNNPNIKKRNNKIKKIANDKDIFYLDVNEAVVGKNGAIPAKYTFDEVHLKAPYYQLWLDYLKCHAVVR